jgi:RNA polymerase sigma factor (sigma-70 family)
MRSLDIEIMRRARMAARRYGSEPRDLEQIALVAVFEASKRGKCTRAYSTVRMNGAVWDRLRKRGRQNVREVEWPEGLDRAEPERYRPDAVLAHQEATAILRECLQALAPRQRAIVTLLVIDDAPVGLTAAKLGVSGSTLGRARDRALRMLRTALEARKIRSAQDLL